MSLNKTIIVALHLLSLINICLYCINALLVFLYLKIAYMHFTLGQIVGGGNLRNAVDLLKRL